MAHAYNQALEEQLSLAKHYVGRSDWLIRPPGETATGLFAAASDRDSAAEMITFPLRFGDPFYWSPEMCGLLEQTAASLPDYTLRSSDLLSPWGFVWFAKPLTLPALSGQILQQFDAWPPGEYPLAAMTWGMVGQVYDPTLRGKPSQLGYTATPPDALRVASIAFYVIYRGLPTLAGATSWYEGEHLNRLLAADVRGNVQDPRGDLAPFIHGAMRYLAASFALMQQRILVTERRPAARATRKRVAPYRPEVPLVRVVELRRPAHKASREGEPEIVEWSCRWVVSGHWRQQYYPSTDEHRPVFVLPYVKGPTDKPLKPPRAKVFAVVR